MQRKRVYDLTINGALVAGTVVLALVIYIGVAALTSPEGPVAKFESPRPSRTAQP